MSLGNSYSVLLNDIKTLLYDLKDGRNGIGCRRVSCLPDMYSVVVSFSERAKHRTIVLYIIIIPLHHYSGYAVHLN